MSASAQRLWILIIVGLLCLPAILASSCVKKETASTANDKIEFPDYTIEALLWADSVSLTLSPRSLAAQMVMPAFYANQATIDAGIPALYADSLAAGGAMLLKGDTLAARSIASQMQAASRLPMFIAIDAEWGLGMRLDDAPFFPLNSSIAADVDDQLMYEYGNELAREARALGINMVLGPVLDVAPPHTPLALRSFGNDPERVATLGTAYARGVEDGNVISVAKHFPGLGRAQSDTHVSRPVIQASREALDTTDLLPFKEYANQGMSAVMIGHAAYTGIDTIIRSAAVSPLIIGSLLRNDLKFQGLVITDAMNMRGLGNVAQPYKEAILAGADIVLAPQNTRQAINELTEAISSGTLPLSTARERVSRILFFKYCLGTTTEESGIRGIAPLHTPQASAIARRLKG